MIYYKPYFLSVGQKFIKISFFVTILNKLKFRGSKVIGGKKKKKSSNVFRFSIENGHRKCYAKTLNRKNFTIYPTLVAALIQLQATI